MKIFDNFSNPDFWVKVLQLASIFFVIFVGISLLLSNFGRIISGEFAAIYEEEWSDGKWVNYILIKAAISLVYAIYMTSRRKNFNLK